MCAECGHLRAKIQQQAKLLRLAKKIIRRQRQQLDEAQIATWQIIQEAQATMSQGLPRSTWALWKGRLEVAHKIYQIVWVNWSTRFLELWGSLGGI